MVVKSDSNLCSARFNFPVGFKFSKEIPQLPHVVEHLIMSTPHIGTIRSNGSDINAHTNESNLSVDLVCLSEDFSHNVGLIFKAFDEPSINDFEKNLNIVRNELKTVNATRILFEDNMNKIEPELFASHDKQVESLNDISENNSIEFWSNNLQSVKSIITYVAPQKLSVLERPITLISKDNFNHDSFHSKEVASSLPISSNASITTKTIALPIDLSRPRERAVLTLLIRIINKKLSNELRNDGLIYSLSSNIYTSLLPGVVIINFTFRSDTSKTKDIAAKINLDLKITYDEFAIHKKRSLISFIMDQQTDWQRLLFYASQDKGKRVSYEKFLRMLSDINIDDITKAKDDLLEAYENNRLHSNN